jgi:hypothetical protein
MYRPIYIPQNNINNKVFQDAANVFTKLKQYDDAYTNYLTCLENHPIYTDDIKETNQRDPSLNFVYDGTSCIPPDSTTLIQNIRALQKDIQFMTNNADSSFNDIVGKHKQVVLLRNQLDLKLQQLYSLRGSIPVEVQKETDQTLYATIMWTVLATCMLYYIFAIEME